MSKLQIKKYRAIGLIISLFIIYLLFRKQTYEYKAYIFLPKVHPNKPWEFVADFSNMKYLNPTITDFSILDESGNYEHWKYSTEYFENLSHWPYLPNRSVAHFDIKAFVKNSEYYINSVHRTCLFMGFYCLNSESVFKFSDNDETKGASCEENVKYECPSIFSLFCRREVIYQRKSIMNNLYKHFIGNTMPV
ncbi:uncharacterized protein LOC130895330 [Diorhabda carinulata]|uniref:uncharacterized protein LOC130895330 n=1 Tax=Diorhabda carinulata TaxID=1163345 RepID=UPI0025A02C93|nr:uncharacterized protein LOC130895330 [Diorhabda carinulata]